jgi:hypothetical protein
VVSLIDFCADFVMAVRKSKLYRMEEIEKVAKDFGWDMRNNYCQITHSDEKGSLSVVRKYDDEGKEEKPYRFLVFKKRIRKKEIGYDCICINGMASWNFMRNLDPSVLEKNKD